MIANVSKRYFLLCGIVLLPLFNLLAQCDALFSYSVNGLTVTFSDNSTTPPEDPIIGWTWDFADGNSSNLQNPVHTYLDEEDLMVTLTILTQNGCTATTTVTIDLEPCLLDVDLSLGNCDADGNVEISILIIDVLDNARDVTVLLDNQALTGSPFEISQETPVQLTTTLPGDGLEHTLVVTSTDILSCQTTTIFMLPDCSSDCFLSGLTLDFSNGASHTIIVGPGGGNSFSPQQVTMTLGDVVNFIWEDDGHSTTSDAVSGNDSWNSGLLGVGAQYAVNIQNPGVHPYYCIPHGGPGGVGMSGQIIANCPENNSFDLAIEFQSTQASSGGYQVKVDDVSVPGSPFAYNGTGVQSLLINLPGDGLSHTVEIVDVDDPTCVLSRVWDAPDCGQAPQCALEVTASEVSTCDPQNMVEVQLDISSVNGGPSGFNVFLNGISVIGTPFMYQAGGQTQLIIQVPGDGGTHQVTVEDIQDQGCFAEVSLVTTDCSLGCGITNLQAVTGSSVTHIVNVEDFQFNPAHITIAAGDIVEWQWTGDIAHTTTSDASDGSDSWNSGLLGNGEIFQSPVLSAGIHPYYCIPHGGPGGQGMSGSVTVLPDCTEGMVTVNLNFDQMITGNNGFDLFVDGVNTGNFAYGANGSTSLVVFIAGDGQMHSIEVRDADLPDCNAQTDIITANCNAQTCQIILGATAAEDCLDGFVNVEMVIEDNGGGSNLGFQLQLDGIIIDTIAYSGTGTTTINLPVLGDGFEHTLAVTDLGDPQCSASISLIVADCNEPCSLSNLTAEVAGTVGSQKHIVEVADFEFIPNELSIAVGDTVLWIWSGNIAHTTTSDAEIGADSWNSDLLTQGGEFEIVITTEGFHPYYCIPHGGPGGQGMSGSISAFPPPPPCDSLGNVNLNISFVGTGTGEEGYVVLLDGTLLGNYDYSAQNPNNLTVPLPGDGLQHEISIADVSAPDCNIATNIVIPLCDTTGNCIVDLEAQIVGECDENNNVAVSLTTTGSDTGNGFQVFLDGELFSLDTFLYAVTPVISLPGSGEIHLIEIVDIDFPECTASVFIELPYCTQECSLELGYEQISGCDDEGNVEYNLIMSVSNPGNSGFKVFVDDLLLPGAPFPYDSSMITVAVELPGDGATHEIVFTDDEQITCSDTVVIVTDNCDVPCELSNLEIFYQVAQVHLVEVRDFDFFPKEIQVDVGDTVRWIWTGDIAHTSTSDAISGDDTWNSGLLENGAVFDVVISTAGSHPYYCIPHGAPGGEGMSGTITASEPCEDGELDMLFKFSGQSLGLNGFQVFLDEEELSGSPFPYMEPENELYLNLAGDGLGHSISINDFDVPECLLDSLFIMPDCSDPCWTFMTSFHYETDLLTKEVFCTSTVENAISWFWDFGDGFTAETENASHVYEMAGNYEICLTVQNDDGCMDTHCELIVLEDIFCVADMSYEQTGYEVLLTDSSMVSDSILNWSWSLNGVLFSQDSIAYFEYDTIGIYTICLEIETGQCSDEQCWDIDLTDPCLPLEAGFSYEFNASDLSIHFFDQSSGNPDSWLWGFGTGDLSDEQNPVYYFEEAGNYTICLLVQDLTNGCLSSTCDTINFLTTSLVTSPEYPALLVYPNPIILMHETTIYLEGFRDDDLGNELIVEFYNMAGQNVFESKIQGEEVCPIELNERFTPGIYFITAESENRIYRARLLVQ